LFVVYNLFCLLFVIYFVSVDFAVEGASALQWLLEQTKHGLREKNIRPIVLLDTTMPVVGGKV
jgi:hypothetical protein